VTAVVYSLNRHRDVSGVSGEGDEKATVVEFASGLSVLHWNSDTPSIQVHTDVRHILDLHGHGGASTLELYEGHRLLTAYQQTTVWLLSARFHDRPISVKPHPDHLDRLLLTFKDERPWRMWIALLDGSTYAATHEEVKGQIRTTWVSPDGNLWLEYSTPGTFMDLLEGQTYDEYPDHDCHDPRD
jgi:hypothetical protein